MLTQIGLYSLVFPVLTCYSCSQLHAGIFSLDMKMKRHWKWDIGRQSCTSELQPLSLRHRHKSWFRIWNWKVMHHKRFITLDQWFANFFDWCFPWLTGPLVAAFQEGYNSMHCIGEWVFVRFQWLLPSQLVSAAPQGVTAHSLGTTALETNKSVLYVNIILQLLNS